MARNTSPCIIPTSVSKVSPVLFPMVTWIRGLFVGIKCISSSSSISCSSLDFGHIQ